ncbi:alpha/beta fold hydrolase [Actinophytocola sp.]|uniref:alpha/beta fold hydrolase n=1 Tax=Actinophytocola sp. TaxID=1872138 RepID=UPI002D8068AC|nr:alpha/beta fold hydrolase [Actinophytocola sp.]HET9142962.1 alpha/beta fold hydrolase [Actinophytocola sp.]
MKNRRWLSVTMIVATATLGLVASPVATAQPARPPSVNWQPCPGAEGIDCATIEVPLDWARPRGEKIHIGLARRPAKNPATRIGSLLINPGGPGGSGVEFIKSNDVLGADTARFDQIGFDPRGINTSSQLLCDLDLSEQSDAAKRPTSQAEFDALARINRRLHDSCRANSGPLADHADNLHTVRDMDAIRAALGEQKLTFLGYSYGSLMGQQYAELFPHRVRALVMDGNMDHSIDNAWDFMRSETAPVEHAFAEFANWCDNTETCALHGLGTIATYTELKAHAKAGTLRDADGEPVSFYDLADIGFRSVLPQLWSQVAQRLRDLRDGTGTPTALSAFGEIVNDPYPAIWCSDWRYPVRNYAEYAGLRARLAQRFPIMEWSPYVDHAMSCVNSGTRNTNPQHPLRVDHAPPIVMIGNVHDYATVYEWTLAAVRQSGARLITYEGWGHTVYGGNFVPCVDTAVNAYLIDLTPPPRGLRCPSIDQPGLVAKEVQPRPNIAGPYRIG